MRSTNLSPAAAEIGDFDERHRAVNNALTVTWGDRGAQYGISDLVLRTHAAVDHLGCAVWPGEARSSSVRSVDANYAEALALLDDLERVVRPAIEESRRLAADLAQALEDAEATLAERAAAERREADFEKSVQREVDKAEQDRLDRIETQARKRLMTTGAS